MSVELFKANAALTSLQKNACAMNTVRSRLESRINFILAGKGSTDGLQELIHMLELVRNGEMILKVVFESMESACYLSEFVSIIENAASSVGDVKNDLEQMIPVAELSLSVIDNAIAKMPTELLPELTVEPRQDIFSAISSTTSTQTEGVTSNVDDKERMQASEDKEKEKQEQEQKESLLA
jgi:hypothetical protein